MIGGIGCVARASSQLLYRDRRDFRGRRRGATDRRDGFAGGGFHDAYVRRNPRRDSRNGSAVDGWESRRDFAGEFAGGVSACAHGHRFTPNKPDVPIHRC